jgi:hypothetical protein
MPVGENNDNTERNDWESYLSPLSALAVKDSFTTGRYVESGFEVDDDNPGDLNRMDPSQKHVGRTTNTSVLVI